MERKSKSKNEIEKRSERDGENTVKQNVSLGAISSRGTELRNAIKIASFHPRTRRRYPREFENERETARRSAKYTRARAAAG